MTPGYIRTAFPKTKHIAMAKSNKAVDAFMASVKQRNGGEPEFLQAVHEVAEMVIPFIEANPKYKGKMLLERMVEPERTIIFRCLLYTSPSPRD